MHFLTKSIAAIILAACAAGSALASTIYANKPDGEQAYTMGYLVDDTTTYGQVFKAPGGKLLDWTFYLTDGNDGNGSFVIAGWDGTKAVGPALYRHGFSYASGTDVATTIGGIGLDLGAGGSYVAYMTVAGVTDPYGGVYVSGSDADGGLKGYFAFLNSNGADPLKPGSDWEFNSVFVSNLQFKASFAAADADPAPVPEPGSLMLLAIGCVGLARLRARRA